MAPEEFPKINDNGVTEQALWARLEAAGQKERLDPELLKRLSMLEDMSKFNEDSTMIAEGIGRVEDYLCEKYRNSLPQKLCFSEEQKVQGRIAALLHDIGKSGPAEASPEQQKDVIYLYALEEIRDPKIAIADAVAKYFKSEEAPIVISRLENIGVAEDMTMRQFWDKHGQWTHDVLEKYPDGLSKLTRVIAGSHHIDRGINPYNISKAEVPPQAKIIGTVEDYQYHGRVLMAVDKYQASARRSSRNHEESMTWLKSNMRQFSDDELTNIVLEVVDELGKENALFSETR